jgi:4-amino-4-deoxy-L-arabinose transferase-like glycosyltransferase
MKVRDGVEEERGVAKSHAERSVDMRGVSDAGANGALKKDDWSKVRFYAFLLYLIVLACILYFALSVYWSKFSRAEVFFAESAREMMEANNLITPLYRRHPFFDKPILTYWLIILMFKNFGFLHLAARVPSIFAGLSTVALTGMGGSLLFNRKTGVMAAGVLASAFMYFAFSALCMSDALLILFDTLTLTCLYASLKAQSGNRLFFWLASVTTGLAFLTKGPVAIVLPAATFFAFALMTGRLGAIRFKDIFLALVTITVIASPWFVAAYQANGWSALNYFFIHENVQRFTGGVYDAHRPVWYTLLSLLYGFAPWSIFLPFALFNQVRIWKSERDSAAGQALLFLWTWTAITLVFFSMSKGKCDYYMLPVYPACAILVSRFIDTQVSARSKVVPIILAVFCVGFFAAALGSAFIGQRIVGGQAIAWLLAPFVLASTGIFMAFELEERRYIPALISACGGILLSSAAFAAQVLPAVQSNLPIDKYAAAISTSRRDAGVVIEKQLYSWQDEITFLTSRHPQVPEDNTALTSLLNKGGRCLLIVKESTWRKISSTLHDRFRLVSEDYAITKPLTPGLVLSTGGKMTDLDPILLLANF